MPIQSAKLAAAVPALRPLIDTYQQLTAGAINYALYNEIVHTHHSTAVEGNTLNLAETEALLEKKLTAGGKPLEDHLMALDHQVAFQQTIRLATQRTPLTIENIKELAGLVMRQTGGPVNTILGNYDTSRGDLRLSGVYAGTRMFMDAQKVPATLRQLIHELNMTNEQLRIAPGVALTEEQLLTRYELSFNAHYQFVTIHPFGDGNGRTARLLMNYVQQYHYLPLSVVYGQDRMAYVGALEASRQQQETTPIVTFLFGQLATFLQEEGRRLGQQQQPRIVPPKRGKGGSSSGLSFVF